MTGPSRHADVAGERRLLSVIADMVVGSGHGSLRAGEEALVAAHPAAAAFGIAMCGSGLMLDGWPSPSVEPDGLVDHMRSLEGHGWDPILWMDGDGLTALHHAAGRGDRRGVAWLLDHGAVVDREDHAGGRPIHHAAADEASIGTLATVGLLLDAGADPLRRDHEGRTPTWWCLDRLRRGAWTTSPDRRALLPGALADAAERLLPIPGAVDVDILRWMSTNVRQGGAGHVLTAASGRPWLGAMMSCAAMIAGIDRGPPPPVPDPSWWAGIAGPVSDLAGMRGLAWLGAA